MAQHLYYNVRCHRQGCENPKAPCTPTTFCDECNELPCCNECGEPIEDCDAGRGGYPCNDRGGMSDNELRAHERRQMGICS